MVERASPVIAETVSRPPHPTARTSPAGATGLRAFRSGEFGSIGPSSSALPKPLPTAAVDRARAGRRFLTEVTEVVKNLLALTEPNGPVLTFLLALDEL
jgi:hypothetical protein